MNNFGTLSKQNKWGVISILALASLGATLTGFAQGTAAAAPATASSNEVYIPSLTGIVVVGRSEDVKPAGIPDVTGVVVNGPKFLQNPDFENLLRKHLNTPLTEGSAKALQVEIIKYCRSIDHSVVDVLFREQEIVNGTIQIAVVEGLVGKITVKNDGAKAFSDTLILGNLHLKSGEPIIQSKLDSDINWLNQNGFESLGTFEGSFRDVQTELTPGDNLGEVNVNLLVTDRSPLRVFAGYDNDGIPVIGKNRAFGGFDWANAFGVDQRLTYQYTTDTSFNKFRAHLASYVIPLPDHQTLTLLGGFSQVTPDFGIFGPTFANLHIDNGDLYQISLRYTVNLPQEGAFRQNISAGFDYKHINTPLFFGSSSAGLLSTNLIDVDQFTIGYQGYLGDSNGSTAFSVQLVESPGGLTSNDNNAAYDSFMNNTNARASYQYAQVEVRRETILPEGFTWTLRGLVQVTSDTLVASETFGLGGYATLPGYDERTVTGDRGWLIQNEVSTPRISLGNLTKRNGARDWVQGVVFWDVGDVYQQHPTLGQTSSDQLMSAGVGLRLQIADNFHVRVDYGDQIKRNYLNDSGNLAKQSSSQVAVGAELSY